MIRPVGARTQRAKRALQVTRVARRGGLLRVLREVGVVGDRPATQEGAQEFRHALEELGTTYVKLGQLLSSRPDLLPDVYIDELTKLVDDAPPVPFETIERTIDEDLGRELFARIDTAPLASASIAQVHRALMKDGRDVVVKVRRPGVLEQVEGDLVIPEHGLPREQAQHLAREFFRSYIRQVVVEGVYHADPHRGNVFLTP